MEERHGFIPPDWPYVGQGPHGARLIIATWNLDAKASEEHEAFLKTLEADVLLLTEVPPTVEADVLSEGVMTRGQHYAGLRGVVGLNRGPAFAVRGVRDEATILNSVLPWRSMGGVQSENTEKWLRELDLSWPGGDVVWGGDWNQELHGRLWVGCREGRAAILALLGRHRLVCPTTLLPARGGERSIDHIAVPETWRVNAVRVVQADGRLSDHDAVVVDCQPC
jgi:hypothetical protein